MVGEWRLDYRNSWELTSWATTRRQRANGRWHGHLKPQSLSPVTQLFQQGHTSQYFSDSFINWEHIHTWACWPFLFNHQNPWGRGGKGKWVKRGDPEVFALLKDHPGLVRLLLTAMLKQSIIPNFQKSLTDSWAVRWWICHAVYCSGAKVTPEHSWRRVPITGRFGMGMTGIGAW